MRKRKNPDYGIVVYRYWAETVGELPQAAWDQAKAMRWAWNEMVRLRLDCLNDVQALGEDAKEVRGERWKAYAARKDEFLKSAELKAQLGWEAREAVADRFRVAEQQIIRKQKEWARLPPGARAAKGKPELRFSRRLERINLPHRYTGGGAEVSELFGTRSKRFQLKAVPAEAYDDNSRARRRARQTRGVFGLGDDEQIVFRTILHRPLPARAVVKSVSWCGALDDAFGWQWSLNVTVEVPPVGASSPAGRRAGIDMGWRKIGDYIRVGVVHDSSGQTFELRLPFDDTHTSRSEWLGLPGTADDLDALRADMDFRLEAVKEILAALKGEEFPDDARRALGQLGKMRAGGLKRLLRTLRGDGVTGETPAAARDALAAWAEGDAKLRRRYNASSRRLTAFRRWAYENVAAWLADSYDVLVWEGGLGLRDMAEQKTDEPALRAAQRYRQWAGLSVARAAIKRAFSRADRKLVEGDAAYTTTECFECGSLAEAGAKLELTCPKGHRFDQDVNAARNLLAQAEAEEGAYPSAAPPVPEGLRRFVAVVGRG